MNYLINAEKFESQSTKLTLVLEQWGAEPPYAIAVNKVFIPYSEISQYELKNNDAVDVLSPIQGG